MHSNASWGEKNHPNYTCIMRGSKSPITARENDLSIVANFEKMTGQGWAGVKKASTMLGITRKGEKKKTKQKTSLSLCINVWCGPVLGSVCSFSMHQPSHPHNTSKEPEEAQPESRGTMGQLPCKERASVLGLAGCQAWWQRRDRIAGLPGTENKLHFQPQPYWSIRLPAAE